MSTGLLADVQGSYDRLTEDELANLGIVLGAYRSFRGNRRNHVGYVSMPITTGKRFFDVLSAHGLKSAKELAERVGPSALWELVIQPNIQEGIAFADELGKREDLLFIAPSVFEAKKWRWSQDAYMSLWYRVLGEMAGRHVVMDGWEYSTGGVKEVMFSFLMQWRAIRPTTELQAVQAFGLKNFLPDMPHEDRMREYEAMWNIKVLDSAGREIHVDTGLVMSVAAISDLDSRGLPYGDLLGPANTIRLTPSVLAPGSLWAYPEHWPQAHDWHTPAFEEAKRHLFELSAKWERDHPNQN